MSKKRIGGALLVLVFAAGMKRKVYACAVLVLPLIYVMSFIRDFVRIGYLETYFSPAALQVRSQYSPMFMFFASLIAGIVAVAWMLVKAHSSFIHAKEKE